MRYAWKWELARGIRLAPALVALSAAAAGGQITVVNMIPKKWSNETTQNSEPSLTMHPMNPNIAVASSFMSGSHFCHNHSAAPVFVSKDNGNTWDLACVLPTAGATSWPMDMTMAISGDGTRLYGTTLDVVTVGSATTMSAHLFGWKPNFLSNSNLYAYLGGATRQTLYERGQTDQPYVVASTLPTDRSILLVGQNRVFAGGTSGDNCKGFVAVYSTDPWPATPTAECKGEERPFVENMTASRPAIVGTDAYIVAYRQLDANANDVVLYRRGSSQFDKLTDDPASGTVPAGTGAEDCERHDGKPGKRVFTCVPYADDVPTPSFGQERRERMELAIAVHPTNPSIVAIAWAEKSPTIPTHLQLNFAVSPDDGATWSRWKVDHATNPTLAIASDGAIGMLYQELVTHGVDHWQTKLAVSTDNLATTPQSKLLADQLADAPTKKAPPYLGDYLHLEAVAKNFYGVFPASNDLTTGSIPDLCPATTCPNQRSYDPLTKALIGKKGLPVAPSIDPYFFRMVR